MPFCDSHTDIVTTLARMEERQIAINERLERVDKRINGSIDDIKHHIENSRGRNIAIVLAFISIFATIFWNYGDAKQETGSLKKQVEINTGRWDKLIQKINIKDLN